MNSKKDNKAAVLLVLIVGILWVLIGIGETGSTYQKKDIQDAPKQNTIQIQNQSGLELKNLMDIVKENNKKPKLIFPYSLKEESNQENLNNIFLAEINKEKNDKEIKDDKETVLVIETIDTPTVTKPIPNEIQTENTPKEETIEVQVNPEPPQQELQQQEPPQVTEPPSDEVIRIASKTFIKKEYVQYADEIIRKHFPKLKLSLVVSIIEAESDGDANKVNSIGCKGLMQVYEKYHKDKMKAHGVTDILDPYSNILIGCQILNNYYREWNGNLPGALMRYNGSKNVAEKVESGNYTPYVYEVINRMNELES